MSDSPSADILKALESPTPPKISNTAKIPPMPKKVAEKLKKLAPEEKVSTAQETKQVLPEISATDKMAFIAHMMGAPRFHKKYELYGGSLVIVLQTKTAEEDERCVRAATKKCPDPVLANLPAAEHQAALQQAVTDRVRLYRDYSMLLSVQSVTRGVGLVELPEVADIDAAYESFIATTSGPFLATLRLVSMQFENLVTTMMSLADSPDFWKAASQA